MFGRKVMRGTPAAIGTTNTRIASHFRRPQMASNMSSGDRLRVISMSFSRSWVSGSLRNQNDVAVAKVEVLLPAGDLVVVEGNSLHRLSVGLENDDIRARRELREPACQGEDVEHGRPALQLIAAGAGNLADDRHFEAFDVRHDDRDFRGRHVVRELLSWTVAALE